MSEEPVLIGLDLSHASPELIAILLEDLSDPGIVRDIIAANSQRPEIIGLIMASPHVPDEMKGEIRKHLLPAAPAVPRHHRPDEEQKLSLLQRIQHLSIGEKIALAMRGGPDIRSILLKDSNKEVVLTVLKNPKMTEKEVESVAHSRNIPEEALRTIHKNREWLKNYSVVLALINNPKTPPGIGMTLVPNLRTKDLAILEKNKNVPEAVRVTAKKTLQAKKPH